MRNLKKFLNIAVVLLILLSINISSAVAKINIPEPVGYVNDFAGVISPNIETKLDSLSKELKSKTGAEVVVVSLKSLDGYPVEDVALEIGRKWKIGQTGKNNGLVILVAPNDRKMRIEVGYGLEGIITDSIAGRIRTDYMIPYFKRGDYNNGIDNGTSAIIFAVAKGYGVALSNNYSAPLPTSRKKTSSDADFFVIIFIIFLLLMTSKGRVIFFPLFFGGGFSSGSGGGSFGGFSGGGGFGGGGASGGW